MSKFTAFPVKGDAFLLERENYSILVDAGTSSINPVSRNKYDFGKRYKLHNGSTPSLPQYIICSHRHADHITGVLNLLNYALLHQLTYRGDEEIWIPYYLGEYKQLYKNYRNYLDFIISCEDIIRENLARNEMQPTTAFFPLNYPFEAFKFKPLDAVNWVTEYFQKKKINKIFKKDITLFFKLVRQELFDAKYYPNLLKIAQQLGIKIRFFKRIPQNKTPSIYMPHLQPLLPINSKEVTHKRHMASFMEALISSDENKNSLAFFCPETSSENSVLFCADTYIDTCNFGLISSQQKHPNKDNMLITAPHHGSQQHDNSYLTINSNFTNIRKIYVRSQYNIRMKVAPSYAAIAAQNKCCVARCKKHTSNKACNHSCNIMNLASKQDVSLEDNNNAWTFSTSTTPP